MGTCTGIVIDSDGNHSNQIDVIIFDRNVIPPSMLSTDEGVIPSESVLACIEIKSKLTISELKKAVNNARSLKTLHPYFNEIASNHNYKNSPEFYLFAYYSVLKKKSEYEQLKKIGNYSAIFYPISGNKALSVNTF